MDLEIVDVAQGGQELVDEDSRLQTVEVHGACMTQRTGEGQWDWDCRNRGAEIREHGVFVFNAAVAVWC